MMMKTKFFYLSILVTTALVILLYIWSTNENERSHFDTVSDHLQEHQSTKLQTNVNPVTAVDDATAAKSFDENLVIIYNRVPKTGSTSFVNLTYDLCKKNSFHVLHINITANMHVLSLPNQLKYVKNVTYWNAMKPAFYHGHVAFLDFSKFGIQQKPLYINIIRKPLDRLVSYYYFLRYGDDYRPYLVRHRAGDTMTFDECVELKRPDCDPNNMWLQIPFFCGHHAQCWVPGNEWALSQAKKNLVNEYFLVGVTEQLGDFVELLEMSLPRIYKGAVGHFAKSNKSHLRKTKSKLEPSPETVVKIQKSIIWQMENELYEFALQQFQFIQRKLKVPGKNVWQEFMYEKIKPNNVISKT